VRSGSEDERPSSVDAGVLLADVADVLVVVKHSELRLDLEGVRD
jgi:hypothetical protein